MKTISVCVGSACHLQGAYHVLGIFQKLIEENGLKTEIDIEGNFCQGHCTQGVVVKIGEELVFNVHQDNAADVFKQYMLGGK